jgi:hypothetical protein
MLVSLKSFWFKFKLFNDSFISSNINPNLSNFILRYFRIGLDSILLFEIKLKTKMMMKNSMWQNIEMMMKMTMPKKMMMMKTWIIKLTVVSIFWFLIKIIILSFYWFTFFVFFQSNKIIKLNFNYFANHSDRDLFWNFKWIFLPTLFSNRYII